MEFQIDKIADLARLNLKPDEKTKLQNELGSILDYVAKLESLDTASVQPTSHVLDLENVFRPDQIEVSKVRDKALRHAPSAHNHFFEVPKVVEKD